MTGDVDAYMLYKEADSEAQEETAASEELVDQQEMEN